LPVNIDVDNLKDDYNACGRQFLPAGFVPIRSLLKFLGHNMPVTGAGFGESKDCKMPGVVPREILENEATAAGLEQQIVLTGESSVDSRINLAHCCKSQTTKILTCR